MANTNARFVDLGAGQQSEQIATNVVLMYNATTEAASANFHSLPHLLVANTYYSLGDQFKSMLIDFSDKMTNQYANGLVDPVTNASLGDISIAGMMVYIKAVFDTEYNAQATANIAHVASSP